MRIQDGATTALQGAMTAAARRRLQLAIAAIAAALVVLWFARHIPRTVTIFAVGAFIAFGVQPVVVRLERRMARPLAIATVYLVLLLAVAVGMIVVVPLTVEQVEVLARNAPGYVGAVQGFVQAAQAWVQAHFPGLDLHGTTLDVSRIGSERLGELASTTLSSLGTILLNAATAIFVVLSALVLSVFFLLYDKQIVESMAALFPPAKRETARAVIAETTQVFGSYIAGQVIVSAITGLVVAIGSAIVGFRFPVLLGILTGIAYAIPIIGMIAAQAIAALLCIPQGWGTLLWVQVIMFVMARISDSILVPKIMGDSVGVSPIGVMFAVFAGGELFGMPGLLLGIPAAALLKILWKYFAAPWLQAQYAEEAVATSPPER